MRHEFHEFHGARDSDPASGLAWIVFAGLESRAPVSDRRDDSATGTRRIPSSAFRSHGPRSVSQSIRNQRI